MKVQNWDINRIKPYENNPRINDASVPQVVESIKQFGWQQPLVVDKHGTIVVGHTRYKAAKQLGLTQIPVVVADELTDDQINAYRLADNKVAELSTWDIDKLQTELVDIKTVNMIPLGFSEEATPDADDGGDATPLEDEPDDGFDKFDSGAYLNLEYVDNADCEPEFGFPILRPCHYVPDELQGFNFALNKANRNATVHYFIDDYQFERLWRSPEQYVEAVSQYRATLTPDFSLYTDMPKAMQIWNIFRARLLGNYWQSLGIEVIPTVSWSDESSFDFCFNGLPRGGTVALATSGVRRSDETKELWRKGVSEMIKHVNPDTVLLYGDAVDYDWGSIQVKSFKNNAPQWCVHKKGG